MSLSPSISDTQEPGFEDEVAVERSQSALGLQLLDLNVIRHATSAQVITDARVTQCEEI